MKTLKILFIWTVISAQVSFYSSPVLVASEAWGASQAAYQPFNPQVNPLSQPYLNPALNNTYRPLSLNTFQPLTLDLVGARLPEFNVMDLEDKLWSYKNSVIQFKDEGRLTLFQADVQLDDRPPLELVLKQLQYETGSSSPKSYIQTTEDQAGQKVLVKRYNIESQNNPAFGRYKNYQDQQTEPAQDNVKSRKLSPPSKELITSYQEIQLNTQTKDKTHIKVSDITYDSDRYLSGYKGAMRTGKDKTTFDVQADITWNGTLEGLRITLQSEKAQFARQITVDLKNAPNPDVALKLVRDNIGVPLLIGPHTQKRVNGVDLPGDALQVDKKGKVTSLNKIDQKKLDQLDGKQQLGIQVLKVPVAKKAPTVKSFLLSKISILNSGFGVKPNINKLVQRVKLSPVVSKNIKHMREAFKNAPLTAKPKILRGFAFSILSGDIKNEPFKFNFKGQKHSVVVIPGMNNNQKSIEAMFNFTKGKFGVTDGAVIRNLRHGFDFRNRLPAPTGDIFQTVGYEKFDTIDLPAIRAADAIRAGIAENGVVHVVAHSQGSAVFEAALDLLTDTEKSKIHYQGFGSETYIDGKDLGLASSINVWNRGDVVPVLGNFGKFANAVTSGQFSVPKTIQTTMDRLDQNWTMVDSPANNLPYDKANNNFIDRDTYKSIDNKHNFIKYYSYYLNTP